MTRLTTEQALGFDKFVVDDEQAHIKLDLEICNSCDPKPCTHACPAGLYVIRDGKLAFDHAGCLECGTCRVVCPRSGEAIAWGVPRGGFGIHFRFG
ncbi:MAG TPA: 4Fe-4S dicluster domain-containing protein [Thermoleophilia bacterium]|nr:4Fe-4S dicluster domain-containing protein [Thermoleophilia bacterium]